MWIARLARDVWHFRLAPHHPYCRGVSGRSEPLTATDASFLRIETDHEPQHVGSVSIFEGAPLRGADGDVDIDRLRKHVGGRLHRVPRLRQHIKEVPLGQGRPVWVDDAGFDLDFHVRLTALPKPGTDGELCALMSRLQSLPLDRRRPLWEMWFVDGLESGDVALIIKTHHALGDGIANVDLALALVDTERSPEPTPDPPEWNPRPSVRDADLLGDAVWHQLTRPVRLAEQTAGAIRHPRAAFQATSNVARTLAAFALKPAKAPWNKAVTPHRRWVHADASIDLVSKVRERHDVTMNDVVLAACTASLRNYLMDHDVDVDDRTMKAMVPVSIRGDEEHGDTLGNRISLIIVELPIDETDSLTRLERLHASMTEHKQDAGLMDGAQRIIELADVIPALAVPLTKFVSRSIPMNLAITNIPGPPIPLYLQGAKLLRTYPYVEVIDNEGLTIAVISYEGQLFFGLTSDRDVLPDLGDLAAGIEQELYALASI